MSDEDEWRQCPFCASKQSHPEQTHIFAGEELCCIRCEGCGATGPIAASTTRDGSIIGAADHWNTRPPAATGSGS